MHFSIRQLTESQQPPFTTPHSFIEFSGLPDETGKELHVKNDAFIIPLLTSYTSRALPLHALPKVDILMTWQQHPFHSRLFGKRLDSCPVEEFHFPMFQMPSIPHTGLLQPVLLSAQDGNRMDQKNPDTTSSSHHQRGKLWKILKHNFERRLENKPNKLRTTDSQKDQQISNLMLSNESSWEQRSGSLFTRLSDKRKRRMGSGNGKSITVVSFHTLCSTSRIYQMMFG